MMTLKNMTDQGVRGDEVFAVGDVLVDVGNRLLTRSGAVVPLPPKTFELLVTLVRRAPGVVTRQELLDYRVAATRSSTTRRSPSG